MAGAREPGLGVGPTAVGGEPGLRRRRAAVEVAVTVTLILVGAATLLWIGDGFRLTSGVPAIAFPIVMAGAVAYAASGAVIVVRRPERRIGSVLIGLGLLIATLYAGLAVASSAGGRIGVDEATAALVAVLAVAFVSTAAGALGAIFGILFPTDRPLPGRWSWGIAIAAGGALLAGVGHLLRPGPILFLYDLDNPLGQETYRTAGTLLLAAGIVLLAASALIAIASLVVRYRVSDVTVRRQIRLVVAAGIALAAAYLAWLSVAIAEVEGPMRSVVAIAFAVAVALSPIAILVAMLRRNLYEIDHVVGRTFVYAALMATLAGIFAASSRLLQVLFAGVLGESSDAIVVVSTLIAVTTVTPLKGRLETVAGRWDAEGVPTLPLADSAASDREIHLDPGVTAVIESVVDRRVELRLSQLIVAGSMVQPEPEPPEVPPDDHAVATGPGPEPHDIVPV